MIIEKEIVVIAENNNQERLYDWIEKNRYKLQFLSEDSGCGCCVSIITVQGEEKIINTLPEKILLVPIKDIIMKKLVKITYYNQMMI